MKKEKRTMGFDEETDSSLLDAMKVKKKKRKTVRSATEETNQEHSMVVETSPDKKHKRSIGKDKKKKLDAAQPETEKKKKVGSTEAAAKRKMKEKKRTKRAVKKAKKVEQKSESSEPEVDAKAETLALEYLQQWNDKRDEWSFQKVRQVWLLKHMYDTQKMSADNFAIMLNYIDGLKGNGRSLTVAKAEKLLAAVDSSDEEEEDDDSSEKKQPEGEKMTEDQEERVRAVLQMLA